ncbi:MAG TPA: LysR family transcriptional regulator [Bacteriovoracaceae bacterium]|nr:LysR family transcriptional regulator [Bacteriovoracaceae bacterium]
MLENHLEKLVVFVGVVDSGSIRKYALSKRLSQPGVSQRVTSLERQIGLPLLIRTATGIELTKHGRIIYEMGLKLIELAQATESSLYKIEERKIEIKMGTYDSVAIYLMPQVLNQLQILVPNLNLNLFCDRSASIIKLIEDGSLDCGLCVGLVKSKRVEVTPLFEDQYSFYHCAGSYQRDVLITVPDAVDQESKSIADHIKLFFLERYHLLQVPSFEIAKAMTLAGLGIGIIPNAVAADFYLSKQFKKAKLASGIPKNFGLHSFNFIQRKGTSQTAAMRIILQVIVKEHSRQILKLGN